MSFGNVQRSYDELVECVSQWDIGATGAHTKTSTFPGKAFASVARTAAGKYTITFAEVPAGPLVDLTFTHWCAANAGPKNLRPTVSSYSRSAKTVTYECWNVQGAPAQTELVSGDKVTITAKFLKTA